MHAPPLAATTTAAALAARLRQEIDQGRWQAGELLRQEQLASEFGVSRIPVREALAQLQSEGLLRIEHYRGARVSWPTPAEIDEIFDLRLLVESDLIARALPRHGERSCRELARLQDQLEDAQDRLGWIGGDIAFHEALYRLAERPRSLALYRQLRAPIDRFSVQQLGPEARKQGWAEEHRQLIAAAAAGDVPAALATLAAHLDATRVVVLTACADLGDR
ncbi:MAG TPA: GntR family transcriptional regulator [Bosea sp. (in: a-proteobacteria)]|jgi:DNA-binding GntR family transcriptional regulator|uniref:GntR family transcriptional regulator n=1 Tax=Bosea sp. (in: a-proteobacteria) TaxID=1871050 RepID=UPI002E0FC9DE|nr:GntR family transcriptional regulator [Bosea sp. (in: a-proteobacteria)]